MRRFLLSLLFLSLIAIAVIELAAWAARHPQDLPWTALDLDQPAGRFTAARIAALGSKPEQCRALLAKAGARDRPVPPISRGASCEFTDGVRVFGGGAREAAVAPGGLVTSCPVAAALLAWEEQVVQPAARRLLDSDVKAIVHAGSYSCRRINGAEGRAWSEHATADAIDVTGFRLTDGRTVSVIGDWSGEQAEAQFLREVRDGACRFYTTVLSPDYNRAHRDHFHFDTADRGAGGWRACR